MNVRSIGDKVEEATRVLLQVTKSKIGFDACMLGMEIEIKGCEPCHKNGYNSNGRQRYTQGRFWIDNAAHRVLLDEDGVYVFAVYRRLGVGVQILLTCVKTAGQVNPLIGEGENTKIPIYKLFDGYKGML